MEKTYIKYDSEGKIIATFIGNDISFLKNNEAIDISKLKNKEKIVENPKYFKFKDKKISELTTTEKKKVDDTEKGSQPIDPITEAIQKINNRLDIIEKNLKIKVKD